jgi:hypothetical protein
VEAVSFSSIQALLGHRDAGSPKKFVHAYREDLGLALAKLHLPNN